MLQKKESVCSLDNNTVFVFFFAEALRQTLVRWQIWTRNAYMMPLQITDMEPNLAVLLSQKSNDLFKLSLIQSSSISSEQAMSKNFSKVQSAAEMALGPLYIQWTVIVLEHLMSGNNWKSQFSHTFSILNKFLISSFKYTTFGVIKKYWVEFFVEVTCTISCKILLSFIGSMPWNQEFLVYNIFFNFIFIPAS